MTIKHISLPGGGPNFPVLYGVLKYLNINDFWHLKDLESLHCTSCGAIIGVIIILIRLGIPWEDFDNYFINRPWHNTYELTPEMILGAYKNKGVIDRSHFEVAFISLFNTLDLNMNITLKEFYKKSNVEIFFYVTNFTDMKLEYFHHKTHPNIELMDAIQATSALPPVIQPLKLQNILYVDGGFFANNPIKQALDKIKDEKELLGFDVVYPEPYFEDLTEESTIIEYMSQLLSKLAWQCDPNSTKLLGPPNISNFITVKFKAVIKADFWENVVNNSDFRKELIDLGEEYGTLFIKYKKNNVQSSV